ncbi:cytochrome c biogenesis, partial [Listeria ivanovii FSL F6-596]
SSTLASFEKSTIARIVAIKLSAPSITAPFLWKIMSGVINSYCLSKSLLLRFVWKRCGIILFSSIVIGFPIYIAPFFI